MSITGVAKNQSMEDIFRGIDTPSAPDNVTLLSDTSTTLIAANDDRKGIYFSNNTNGTLFFGLGAAAVKSKGISIAADNGLWFIDSSNYKGAVYAIGTGHGTIGVQEAE